VLRAIISLSEGESREKAMETLHLQLSNLRDDLVKDEVALAWFDLARNLSSEPSTPPPLETGFPSSLPADDPFSSFDSSPNAQLRFFFQERFPGRFFLF